MSRVALGVFVVGSCLLLSILTFLNHGANLKEFAVGEFDPVTCDKKEFACNENKANLVDVKPLLKADQPVFECNRFLFPTL